MSGLPLSGSTAGRVARTAFLNYNFSTPGNFGSSVWNWWVGSSAVDPATGELWLPTVPTPRAGVAPPDFAPTLIYNSTVNTTRAIESLGNSSAFAFASNGLLYAADPLNDTVAVFNPVTYAWVRSAIPVGVDPVAIAASSTSGFVYVANEGSHNLTIINATSNRVQVPSFPVGTDPVALAFDSVDSRVWVANSGSMNLSEINALSNTLTRNVPIMGDPTALSYSSPTDELAVGVPTGVRMLVLDAANGATIYTANVGRGVTSILANQSGTEWVVANNTGTRLTTVNNTAPNTVSLGAINASVQPQRLTLAATGGDAYVWGNSTRKTAVVNLTGQRPSTVAPDLGVRPDTVAYTESSGRVLALDRTDHAVDFLNATTFLTARPPLLLPGDPDSITTDSATSIVYVGFVGGIWGINPITGAVVASNDTHFLPGNNSNLLADPSTGLLWDINSASGLLALSLASLTGKFLVGIDAGSVLLNGLAIDPSVGRLFAVDLNLTNLRNSSVYVLDSSSGAIVLPPVTGIPYVDSVAYDAADSLIYALGQSVWAIDPLSGAVAAGPIPIAPHVVAWSIVYDPSRQFLYVTSNGTLPDPLAGNLTVIDGSSLEASMGSYVSIPLGILPFGAVPVILPGSSAAGSGEIWVGNDGSGTISIIASPPEVTFFAASPDPVDVDQATQMLLGYTGGAGRSTVSYSGLPTGCGSADTVSLWCVPTAAGNYTVTATVVDPLGFNANATANLSVNPSLVLTVGLGAASSGQIDVGDLLDATASVTGGTPPASYSWEFGDGSGASGSSVTHTYATSGLVYVSVVATDTSGGTTSKTIPLTVEPLPTVTLSASPSNTTDVGASIALTAQVAGGTSPGNASWTFGDGASGYGTAVKHTYTTSGVYFAKFQYVDASGHNASDYLTIQVNPTPSASVSISPSSGVATGTTVSFSATIHGGTPPYTLVWTFDDGSYAYGLSTSHSYGNSGTYSVTLFVEDAVGASWNQTFQVSVSSSGSSPLGSSFLEGIFLGIVAGAAVAAVILLAATRSRRHRPPPPSPYVPPEPAVTGKPTSTPPVPWKED
jgi:DNA-binding beta-propeller fold protein YncE